MREKLTLLLISLIVFVVILNCGTVYSSVLNNYAQATDNTSGNDEITNLTDSSGDFKYLDQRAFQYYVDATLYEQMGDIYNAARNYNRALNFFKESQEIRISYARVLLQLREVEKAFEALQELKKENEESLGLLLSCFAELQQIDSMVSACHRLITINSRSELGYRTLSRIYRQRKQIDSTTWAVENLLRIQPDRQDLMIELGRMNASLSNPEKAKEYFNRAIEGRNKRMAVISVLSLGEMYARDNQLDSLEIIYKTGLDIDPLNSDLNNNIVNLYIEIDSIHLALPYAEQLAKYNPKELSMSRRYGALLYSVDSLSLADSVFTSIVESGDNNSANHFYLGRIAARGENWYRARDQFIKLTELSDSLAQSWLDLGVAYRRLENSELEIDTYLTGLTKMKDETSAIQLYFALGAAYEQSDQIDKAIESFEEILKHNPDHAQSLNYLGYMLADRNQQLDYAEELITRALEIAPDNAAYLDSFGWVLYRKGNYEQALVNLKQAATIVDDPVIFDHLGDTYDALGNLEQAKIWWQKALEQQPESEEIQRKLSK